MTKNEWLQRIDELKSCPFTREQLEGYFVSEKWQVVPCVNCGGPSVTGLHYECVEGE